jgi:hypothetical protein
MVGYIGAKSLSDEAVASSRKASSLNAFAATKIRASNRGGIPNDYIDQVIGDVNRIVSIYDARMRKNYATSGQAFGDDPLITGDATICKELSETLAGNRG